MGQKPDQQGVCKAGEIDRQMDQDIGHGLRAMRPSRRTELVFTGYCMKVHDGLAGTKGLGPEEKLQ